MDLHKPGRDLDALVASKVMGGSQEILFELNIATKPINGLYPGLSLGGIINPLNTGQWVNQPPTPSASPHSKLLER